jgi:hypothetical protein
MAAKTPEEIVDGEERTTAFGLLHYAHQYQRGSIMVMEQDSRSVVPYMLVAHALELALKAYLRSRGATLGGLKKSGHNLPKLHQDAMREGLAAFWPPASDLLPTLQILESVNGQHALRYIVTGMTCRPGWTGVTGQAEGIIDALKEPCLIHTLGETEAVVAMRNRGRVNVFAPPVPSDAK